MSTIYHRHRGGNHPHVHDHHDHDHHEHHHGYHGHSHHAYDAHGHQPAIIEGNSHELGHWHFDDRFERIAIAPAHPLAEDFPASAVPSIDGELSWRPWAARSPPGLF